MTVTINTDASFNERNQIGTYAFWIVCDYGRIQQSGILRDSVVRPEQAEFKCIINALHVLSTTSYVKKIDKIIINTDCLNVIHLLKKDTKKIKKYGLGEWGQPLVLMFKKILETIGIKNNYAEIRHVRSHISTDSKKEWVNDWCDKAAKEQMRKALNNVSKNNINI